ncbi:MAG: hypothetical protein R3B41_00230 [Candidatus Doudnabacteria bacterium]
MKWILYSIIILGLVVFNQTILTVSNSGAWVPNILMLLTLALVVLVEDLDFLFFAVLGGVWLDITTGLPIGGTTLGLLSLAMLAMWLTNKWLLAQKGPRYFLGAILLGTIFLKTWIWLYAALAQLVGFPIEVWSFVDNLKTLLPQLLMNLLFAYPIFALVDYLVGRMLKNNRHQKFIL